jgi:hypothetical protein
MSKKKPEVIIRTPAEQKLEDLLREGMDRFNEDIGKYEPDSETWNALAFADENFEAPNARMYSYFNGIYRAYLTAKNGKWSEKAQATLWREMQRHSPYEEDIPIQKLLRKVEKQKAKAEALGK